MKSNISLKNTLILSLAAVLGILLGIGGGTLALWSDNASGTGEISSGYEYFAAGRVDDTQAAKDKKASVSLGAAEAETRSRTARSLLRRRRTRSARATRACGTNSPHRIGPEASSVPPMSASSG
ncbi:hypothetical protein IOD13_05080 [Brevibacterium casei]|nr:hypothetical protein [Brevibacterium casei]